MGQSLVDSDEQNGNGSFSGSGGGVAGGLGGGKGTVSEGKYTETKHHQVNGMTLLMKAKTAKVGMPERILVSG